MNWKGKFIGLLLGLLLGRGRPPLLVVGLVLGHLYDIGVLTGSYRARPERPPPPVAPAPDDPYVLLGVARDASNEALEQAYRRRMSEYHPDRVASAAKEIRDMADKRAGEINQAYDRIKRERGIP
jgi:DnaJ-domain-containing protein 1